MASVILSLRRIRHSDACHEKLDRSFGRPALREASLRAQRMGASLRMTPGRQDEHGRSKTRLALGVIDQHLDLVLEAARFDHAVHAALLGAVLFPPPAAGARV